MLAKLDVLIAEATDGIRGVRLRPRARAHRVVLLVVLRRLRRAREGPRLRRRTATQLRRRRARRWAPRSTSCSGCSRRSCRSPPRRRGAGGTTRACTGPPGRHRSEPAAIPSCSTPWPRSSVRCAGPRPRPSRASAPRSPSCACGRPPGMHAAIDAGRGDLADAGSILEITVHDGEQLRLRGRPGALDSATRHPG